MGYIYYIWASSKKQVDFSSEKGGNYIGQSIVDDGHERMLRHLRIAYLATDGPWGGSEELIKTAGASSVFFGVYDDDNYGLDPKIYTLMEQAGWNVNDNAAAKLDAAEIVHILTHNGDLSGGNVAAGGQGNLTWGLQDPAWVGRLLKEFPNIPYDKNQLNTVKINFHDKPDIYYKKLFRPDEYLILRTVGFAIESAILYNVDTLKELVESYFINPNQTKSLIQTKVNDVIASLNQKVFQAKLITSDHVNVFVDIVNDKVLPWIKERTDHSLINSLLNSLDKAKGLNYAVNGLPNFSGKDRNKKNIVHKLSLHIKRSNWIQLVNNTQPAWFQYAQANPAPHPSKHSGNDIEIHREVEECIYQIFVHYLKIALGSKPELVNIQADPGNSIGFLQTPSSTLEERMSLLYAKIEKPMTYFREFYGHAIMRWQVEHKRSVLYMYKKPDQQESDNTPPKRAFYTFESEQTESTWYYEFPLKYIQSVLNVNFRQVPRIPDWTW